jgi:hypothetical protein
VISRSTEILHSIIVRDGRLTDALATGRLLAFATQALHCLGRPVAVSCRGVSKRAAGIGLFLLVAVAGLASSVQTSSQTSNQGSTPLVVRTLGSVALSQQAASIAAGASSAAPRLSPPSAPAQPKVARPATAVMSAFDRAPLHGQRGITVTAYTDPAFVTKTASFLDHLQAIGVDSVSVLVVFTQSTYQSSDPTLASYVPTTAEMQTFITAAHQHGMSVMVRPLMNDANIIAATGGAQWRGTVQPSNPDTWFSAYYNTILLPFASLSGLDAVDVGSELTTLAFTYPDRWTTLIANLRAVRPGVRVTYSSVDWYAVPGQQQPYPSFAPSLDLLGVDAFFAMSGVTNGYDMSQLVRAWQPALGKIAQLSAYYHKPVQFSEIGLASQCCTLTQPFVYQAGAAPNMQAQAAYYAAACQAIRPYHIGIYWWEYNGMDPLSSPSTDNGFSPYGKPAEQEMARCYLGGY